VILSANEHSTKPNIAAKVFLENREVEMADIFISYSKKDVKHVRLFAAALEAEGYSVWWDKNLESGDDFSEVILKQLQLARAVIVLWTEHSINSTFVYAEAQYALHNDKLIPIAINGVSYEDIRPPFNALHTSSLEEPSEYLSVIEKQAITPKSRAPLLKQARYHALIWFGIIGSAVTAFTSMEAILTFSDWAKWISHHWTEAIAYAWISIFSQLEILFPPSLIAPATVSLFLMSTATGVRIKWNADGLSKVQQQYSLGSIANLKRLAVYLFSSVIIYILFLEFYKRYLLPQFGVGLPNLLVLGSFTITISSIYSMLWNRLALASVKYWIMNIALFGLVYILLELMTSRIMSSLGALSSYSLGSSISGYLVVFTYAVMVFATPFQRLFSRMLHVFTMILLLAGLNELAKSDLRSILPTDERVTSVRVENDNPGNPLKSRIIDAYEGYASKVGDAELMFSLGHYYYYRLGDAEDLVMARKWYAAAAAKNHKHAMYRLAGMYFYGKGGVKDFKSAFVWTKRLAELGDSDAMVNLGVLYIDGKGTPQNDVLARKSYEAAAEQGNSTAMRLLGDLYLSGRSVSKDVNVAKSWFEKAAERGDASSMNRLGDLFYDGEGAEQSFETARRWYEEAAKSGHKDALYNLGTLYYDGIGVPRSVERAFQYYLKSAQKGSVVAMEIVGQLYFDGEGVAPDRNSARNWFKKAAKLGSQEARVKLESQF